MIGKRKYIKFICIGLVDLYFDGSNSEFENYNEEKEILLTTNKIDLLLPTKDLEIQLVCYETSWGQTGFYVKENFNSILKRIGHYE